MGVQTQSPSSRKAAPGPVFKHPLGEVAWLPPQNADSTTFDRGRQSPMLLLAECPARGTEPAWSEQLQGLGPWGLRAPMFNPWMLFTVVRAKAVDQVSGPLGPRPGLVTDVL